MTKFQATVLLIQLKKLDQQIQRKEENVSFLRGLLANMPSICLFQKVPESTRLNYFWFAFLYDKEKFGGIGKDRFIKMLNREGIPVSGGYLCPLYEQPFLNPGHRLIPKYFPRDSRVANLNYRSLHHKNAVRLCQEGVGVDHPFLLGTKGDMKDFARAIEKIYSWFNG